MPSRLDEVYAAQVARIRASVNAFALARFGTGAFHDADLEKFLAAVVPVALAGRRQVSTITDAHLSLVLSHKLGTRVAPRGPIDTAALRGVDPTEVYSRPFRTVWWKLSTGLTIADAVSAGAARLTDIVAGDMQVAKTATAQQTLGSHSFGFVRTGGNCDLCSSDAGVVYGPDEQMPMHPGCNCGIEVVNEPPTSPETRGVVIQEHGELGPLLAVAGQHFARPH